MYKIDKTISIKSVEISIEYLNDIYSRYDIEHIYRIIRDFCTDHSYRYFDTLEVQITFISQGEFERKIMINELYDDLLFGLYDILIEMDHEYEIERYNFIYIRLYKNAK